MNIQQTFGEQLRQLRESGNLSLREVAEKIGIDPSLLAKIERDQRPPNKALIKKVATFFQVSEKELLEEYLSDQIAYKILEEDADLHILRVAEEKVTYLKMRKNE